MQIRQVIIPYQLIAGDDNLSFSVFLLPAQRPQDSGHIFLGHFRIRAQLKLPTDILRVVQQNTAGRFQVPPGPSGLLNVIFQGTGDIIVQHEPDILLVDAHAKGIGGTYYGYLALHKSVHDVTLFLWIEPRMKCLGFETLMMKKIPDFMGLVTGRRINNNARRFMGPFKHFRYDLMCFFRFLRTGNGNHFKGKVFPFHTARIQKQILIQGLLKVALDFLDNACLGGSGEAEHGRHRLVLLLTKLPDKPPRIKVVGSEIVPPFGQAMSLIKYPRPDFPLPQYIPNTHGAELLGRQVKNSGIAQPNSFKYLTPFRRGLKP